MVCGEFKRGKSKLINALLDEPTLCPVDVDVTTALVTTMAYADVEKITVVLGQPGQDSARVITRAQIADYVTEQGNPRNQRGARLVVVETPNEKLRAGLVLVDTPGVGGVNVRHTDVTYAFLPHADVVLFVGDALSPLSTTELEFVKLIGRHCRHLIHVVTKIDAAPDYARVAADNRRKLAEALGRPESELPVVPVSSNNKLAYLQSGDAFDLEDSNFPALEAELWSLLGAHRGQVLLGSALAKAAWGLAELRAPLAAELDACLAESSQRLDEMEQQWQQATRRLAELQDNHAQWRSQLGDGLEDLGAQVREAFGVRFAEVRRRGAGYLNGPQLNVPERIVDMLEVDVDALLTELSALLSEQAAKLHGRIQEATGLGLQSPVLKPLTARQPRTNLERAGPASGTGLWNTGLRMAREASFTSGAGATLLSLLGAVAGGAIGFLGAGAGALPGAIIGAKLGAALGGVAGLATGARNGLVHVREADRAARQRQVAPLINQFINDCQSQANTQLGSTLRDLQRAMRDELLAQIAAEKAACERTLASIQAARKLSLAEAGRKAASLKAPCSRWTASSPRLSNSAAPSCHRQMSGQSQHLLAQKSRHQSIGETGPMAKDDLRQRCETLFVRALQHVRGRPALAELGQTLSSGQERLGEPMRVAIVGKIKAGKSTMMNALLGEAVVATGSVETTFNVNWLTYGSPALVVHFKDGRRSEARPIGDLESLDAPVGCQSCRAADHPPFGGALSQPTSADVQSDQYAGVGVCLRGRLRQHARFPGPARDRTDRHDDPTGERCRCRPLPVQPQSGQRGSGDSRRPPGTGARTGLPSELGGRVDSSRCLLA